MPKLSFIIPVFNSEHILESCIRYLLVQSLKDWETIFVLDGQNPACIEIIERMCTNKGIAYKTIQIEHGGACRARNEGAKHASGEYWVFWDSDCLIEPGASRMWVEQLDKRQDIDFIYSGYRWVEEGQPGFPSEPFDPWLLRVNNYISTCFPFRSKLFQGWDESLKSLQDWDFWLTLVERGAKGLFIKGFAFATPLPTKSSISGQGCTPENWLSRMDAVKKKHGIENKNVCVASLQYRHLGIHVAKLISADYRDFPNYHPHRYETIIQIGFNVTERHAESHSEIFSAKNNSTVKRRMLFWTGEDIARIYDLLNVKGLLVYRKLLNSMALQFVEDKQAFDMMRSAGFDVQILPLPLVREDKEIPKLPEIPKFAVDVEDAYGNIMAAIDRSLPDICLESVQAAHKLDGYTGLIHFFSDRSMSPSMKSALVSGRHVISNVQQPYCGYVHDGASKERFIKDVVQKIRSIVHRNGLRTDAFQYYEKQFNADRLREVLTH